MVVFYNIDNLSELNFKLHVSPRKREDSILWIGCWDKMGVARLQVVERTSVVRFKPHSIVPDLEAVFIGQFTSRVWACKSDPSVWFEVDAPFSFRDVVELPIVDVNLLFRSIYDLPQILKDFCCQTLNFIGECAIVLLFAHASSDCEHGVWFYLHFGFQRYPEPIMPFWIKEYEYVFFYPIIRSNIECYYCMCEEPKGR